MNLARRRLLVVINPTARSGAAGGALAPLREHLARGHAPATSASSVAWVESRSGAHLAELVAAATQGEGERPDAIAVAGGDGTVALALEALARQAGRGRILSAVPFGILPVGSGNDFAAALGIPRRLSDAFGVLAGGPARLVDLLEDDRSGAIAVCLATVGFDALALPIVHGGLPRSKALNIYAAVHALLRYRARPLRVTWAGGGHEGPLVFAAASNTPSYGGGFHLAPGARLDDGQLDVCLVKATGPARLLQIFSRVMEGRHAGLPEVIQARSPWVRIEAADAAQTGELPVSFDGELPARATPVTLRCRPAAAAVISPPPAAIIFQPTEESRHVA